MISAKRQAAQIQLAAEAVLVQKCGEGARFPSAEQLEGFHLIFDFISLEIDAHAIKPPSVEKKIKGLIAFEDKSGEITYELVRDDKTLQAKSGF